MDPVPGVVKNGFREPGMLDPTSFAPARGVAEPFSLDTRLEEASVDLLDEEGIRPHLDGRVELRPPTRRE